MDCNADRESIQLKNFPIREFVSSIREKDPEKCWPFESLCAYKDIAESMSLVNLKISEDAEAPELSEGETSKGKEAGSDTQTGFELEIPTANETGSDTATGFELELSEGKEIATATATGSELEISKGNDIGFGTTTDEPLNHSASNHSATANSENDTSGLFLKKRKGVKVTRRPLNKKKQKRLQVEKPRPKVVRRPNHGPEGSRTMTKKRDYVAATEKLAEARRSVEVETEMEKRKKSRTPVGGASGSERGFVLTGSGDGNLMITVNRNPADFSAPGAGNGFMRTFEAFIIYEVICVIG